MQLAYYPGCSLQQSSALYDVQSRRIFSELGAELIEIDDWTSRRSHRQQSAGLLRASFDAETDPLVLCANGNPMKYFRWFEIAKHVFGDSKPLKEGPPKSFGRLEVLTRIGERAEANVSILIAIVAHFEVTDVAGALLES